MGHAQPGVAGSRACGGTVGAEFNQTTAVEDRAARSRSDGCVATLATGVASAAVLALACRRPGADRSTRRALQSDQRRRHDRHLLGQSVDRRRARHDGIPTAFTTLNVVGLTTDIAPASGDQRRAFISDGNVAVNVAPARSASCTTGDDAAGIIGGEHHSRQRHDRVAVGHDIRPTGNANAVGIIARSGSGLGGRDHVHRRQHRERTAIRPRRRIERAIAIGATIAITSSATSRRSANIRLDISAQHARADRITSAASSMAAIASGVGERHHHLVRQHRHEGEAYAVGISPLPVSHDANVTAIVRQHHHRWHYNVRHIGHCLIGRRRRVEARGASSPRATTRPASGQRRTRQHRHS